MKHMSIAALLTFGVAGAAHAQMAAWVKPLEASNMKIVGHNDLNGKGNGGEGLALTQYRDGRRVLFLAHESAPTCFSVIDVTNTAKPTVITQVNTVTSDIRCNSLGLSGTTLVVAHQTAKIGLPHAGMRVFDVADPTHPKEIAFFDTSGPHSRGVHYVSSFDGRYVYLATGAQDFEPINPNDDQFLMIVDMKDPAHPKEAGRWWLPGTRKGDSALPLPRLKIDSGYRLHTILIDPKQPDRAFAGWIDGGVVILDISNKSKPTMIGRKGDYPPDTGFEHTVLPIVDRKIAVTSEESTQEKCADWPKRVWTEDISDETKPSRIAPFPQPANREELCQRGGRFGAHNINLNRPSPYSRALTQTVVAAMFNGGVRVYSIADPKQPREIGYLVPAAPPGNRTGTIQFNDVYVDEKGTIYASDRLTGGLYVMEFTGSGGLK